MSTPPLTVVAISDTHSMHRRLTIPDGDVLVHCGDFCGHGVMHEFQDFVAWFAEQPHKHKIFTAGNHDGCVERNTAACRQFVPDNVNMLLNESIEIEGLKFYGSPWTPRFGHWSFMRARGPSMAQIWEQIPEDVDVLITHGPAYGHGDLCPPYTTPFKKVAGCLDLMNRIRKVQPKVHFFGHIHDGYGVTQNDELNTVFVNAATCNESYEPVNPPMVITIRGSLGQR